MGWASWNHYASSIDYNAIKSQADAMVSSGLSGAGYAYVNIDEGWWQGDRDANGNITVDATLWPGGMTAIADYLHQKGLKAGIYTDAGKNGCGYYYPTSQPAAPNTGSEGHYDQDMLQFQQWGFDLVKVDWCGGQFEGLNQADTYRAISASIAKATATTGRPMVLSACEWGSGIPWNWAPGVAPMWRTSTDIIYYGQTPSMTSMLSNFDQSLHPASQHTGYYNDPDMMMVGMTGLSDPQNRTHMSLWAISGAPLLAGNDLTNMSAATVSTLSNAEVIAVAQDPRGLQAVKVAEDSFGLQVYAKVLSGSGRRAVLLLNRTEAAAPISVRWADLGLSDGPAAVRDLWAGADVCAAATSYNTTVQPGQAVMLMVTGTEGPAALYEAEASQNTLAGGAVPETCPNCSGGQKVGLVGTLQWNGLKADASGLAVATIAYINGDATPRTATVKVNGWQVPTVVAFPRTGTSDSQTVGTVSSIVSLAKGSNSLSIANTSGLAPDLDTIELRPLPGATGVELIGQSSGRCVDVPNNKDANDTQLGLWDCFGGWNQVWKYTAQKQLVVYGNKCLDAKNSGTTSGTPVIIWTCNGQANQQWTLNANGTITNGVAGLCLDASGGGTTNGTSLVVSTCNGAASQKWSRN